MERQFALTIVLNGETTGRAAECFGQTKPRLLLADCSGSSDLVTE